MRDQSRSRGPTTAPLDPLEASHEAARHGASSRVCARRPHGYTRPHQVQTDLLTSDVASVPEGPGRDARVRPCHMHARQLLTARRTTGARTVKEAALEPSMRVAGSVQVAIQSHP
jgi:hypothetical protein